MRALATWCVRHRRTVVVIWIVVLFTMTGLSRAVGTNYTNDFNLPGTESTQAYHLLAAVSPALSGDQERIVFATKNGEKITDPAIVSQIQATLVSATSNTFKGVDVHYAVISPVPVTAPTGQTWLVDPRQIAPGGDVAYATVSLNVLAQNVSTTDAEAFTSSITKHASSSLEVAVSGQLAQAANRPSLSGTGLGSIAALVVLLLVFGSIFAAAMPLASALVALGTATAVIGMLTNVLKMPQFAPELVILIGLGVGVDYALFIVTRHRQGLLEGRDVESSIVNAVNTSGRAVLFAGIIVCIALLGMFALGVSFLFGLAIAASIGVLFTMVAALTLLPALLGFVGPRIMSGKQRRSLAANGPRSAQEAKGFWTSWSNFIDRRPAVPAVVALLVIFLLAAPFLSIRLGISDQGNDPVGSSTRTAYDLLAKGFGPGVNGPLQVVAVVTNEDQIPTLKALDEAIKQTPGVAAVTQPIKVPDPEQPGTSVVMVNVIPTSAPQDKATTDLIQTLRTETIPNTLNGQHIEVLVGGVTAIFVDFAHVLSTKLPLFIGLVVLLSFLLLAVVFRSLLIPTISAVMNLLSIGAAFGILVAVFSWGWLGGVFGVNRPGPIEAFLPVMMFAILFGLSMDYQVFLVSRMHEEWLRSGDNRTAVRLGLARTGKTITAAAAIMIFVFASFILGGERVIKEFGVGLAAGILVDAIVIRMAIVPAVMFIFGKSNWWFPKSLDRVLPRLGLEDADDIVTEPSADEVPAGV